MNEDRKLRRLVRDIYRTPEVEIDCTTCLDHVATYVDRELSGADVAREQGMVGDKRWAGPGHIVHSTDRRGTVPVVEE